MTTTASECALTQRLREIVWADPLTRAALLIARELDLPDWRIVSGAVYNTVWNHLTGRSSGYGINDIDLAYFDASDVSYEAEDRVIRRATAAFAGLSKPLEARNQARAHLWVPDKFGIDYPQLRRTDDALENYASKTHAVAVSLMQNDVIDVAAPFGLEAIFAMRVTPNRVHDNRVTHESKSARIQELWPEVVVDPW